MKFRDIVIAALVESENNIDRAVSAVCAKFESDADLVREHIGFIVAMAARDEARSVIKTQRDVIRDGATHGAEMTPMAAMPNESTLAGYAAVAADSLMNYPLSGGLRLGMATGAQVESEAAWRFKTARTVFTDAKWLKAIRAQLPDDKAIVRAVLNENQLRALRAQAEGKKAEVAA